MGNPLVSWRSARTFGRATARARAAVAHHEISCLHRGRRHYVSQDPAEI